MRSFALAIALAATGVLGLAPLGAQHRTGPDHAVPLPRSIDPTGSRDVTNELNAFLATLPAGTTVEFPDHGRFEIEDVVFLSDRTDVTLDGNGATLVARTDGSGAPVPRWGYRSEWPRSRSHLVISQSSGITVKDLTVAGPNRKGTYLPRLEAQAGFVITGSTEVTLDHIESRTTYGDGVYINGPSRQVRIRDCLLDHNGRQGVAVVAGQDITVEQCAIRSTGRSAIDLEPGAVPISNVRVHDNAMTDTTNLSLAAKGGASDVWFERNRVHGGRGLTVYAGDDRYLRTGIHVLANTGDGTATGLDGILMKIIRYQNVEIHGNRQTVARNVVPIQLVNSCDSSISDNDFSGASPASTVTGSCTAPGLAAPRALPTPTTGAQNQSPPPSSGASTSTAVPGRAVTKVEHDGASAPIVVVAFAAGVAAGVGGLYLAKRLRRT